MSKGIPFDKLMSHSLEDIQAHFPFGAREVSPGRFVSADGPEDCSKPLDELVRIKRDRQVEAPLLKVGSGYTTEPKFSLGKRRRYAGEFGEPEPAAVYPDDLQKFAAKAREDDSLRKSADWERELLNEREALQGRLSVYQSIAQEKGMDIRSDVRVVERRLEAIERKLGIERAA